MSVLLRNILRVYMKPDEEGAQGGGGEAPAPAAPEPEKVPEHVAARMSEMDAIANRNRENIERDLAAQGMTLGDPPAPPAPSPAPADAPAADPAPVDQVALQLGDEPVPVEQLDRVKVRMKIDGQERVITVEEMRREAQLDGAARKRLDDASKLMRELEQLKASMPAAPAPSAPPAGSDAPVSAAQSADVAATAQQIVDAFFSGDAGKATELMTEALGRAQAPIPKPEDLVPQLVPVVRQQLTTESALEKFAADNKDIVGDPHLAAIADANLRAVMQEDPKRSFSEALGDAAKRTRDWMKSMGLGQPTEPAPTPQPSRKLEERKAGIDNVSALSARATTTETPVPSASETIAQMREQRLAS